MCKESTFLSANRCPVLELRPHAQTNTSLTDKGTVVSYTCHAGYEFSGTQDTTACDGQQWLNTEYLGECVCVCSMVYNLMLSSTVSLLTMSSRRLILWHQLPIRSIHFVNILRSALHFQTSGSFLLYFLVNLIQNDPIKICHPSKYSIIHTHKMTEMSTKAFSICN